MEYPEYLHARVSEMLAYQSQKAIEEAAPFVVYGATLMQDGDHFCAILGDLPTGVCGFGKTPKLAVDAFNAAWWTEAKTPLKERHD